ncbi:phosphatidate cytidylyltransferase [Taklimakanibacter deserti]|uniref:phosphatidate cytidylyltransferase n=1 Tax=Taklimakanibacter deserti TaxID=2267839 RepID=UPI000E655514
MAEIPDQVRSANWRDLGIRTLSSAILIPAVLLDVWLGDTWFHLLVALLAVMMAHEWTNIVHDRSSSQFALHAAAGLCGAFLPLSLDWPAGLLVIAVIAAVSAALAAAQKRKLRLWVLAGVPYVGLPAMAFVILRGESHAGMLTIMWLFAVVWAADICAYFAGRLIGGPKLAPLISPKKTWAGLWGAVAGGVAAGIGVGYAAGSANIVILAVLGGVLAVVEQMGDLFESALKRHYGIKDSGRLIPGHGGVLDRVDGLVAAALFLAVIVVAARLFGNGNELFVQ